MFPDIFDRIVDIDDEDYFDEYTTEHHGNEECVNSQGKQGKVNRIAKNLGIHHDRKNLFESY